MSRNAFPALDAEYNEQQERLDEARGRKREFDAQMAWGRWSATSEVYQNAKRDWLKLLVETAFKRGYITAKEEEAVRRS